MSILSEETLNLARRWEGGEEALTRALVLRPETDVDGFLGWRNEFELFWVNHYSFLFSKGYQLRPRYDPVWVPSWISRGGETDFLDHEDSVPLTLFPHLNDATRTTDGAKVVLKQINLWSEEVKIAFYLSGIPDPRNHCVPVLEIFPFPNINPEERKNGFLVMPKLLDFNELPYRSVGELVEALQQFTEGLQFMHEKRIAHRDVCFYNLMMDASRLLPQGFSFIDPVPFREMHRFAFTWHSRKSVAPNKYYIIDFGLSRYYPDGVHMESQVGRIGQDRSAPEFALPLSPYPYDPFKLDIFQLGNSFLRVSAEYKGMEPFFPLLYSMTSQFPEDRPELSEVMRQLDAFTPDMLERPVKFCSRSWLERCLIAPS